MTKPLLVVVSTGMREYREYMLAAISAEYRVHLLTRIEPTWELQYLHGCTVLELPNAIDGDELIAAARAVDAVEPVAGVLTWDEARVLQAAKVAQALGLPGGDPDAVMRCRDKHLGRVALDAAGVPQARSVLVDNVDQALAAAADIGYPVVLKPRALAASVGVVKVDDPDDLRAKFDFAHDTTIPGSWEYDTVVLVEEFLTGEEVGLDSVVHRGVVHPTIVSRKDMAYPPYFEEVGHRVDGADPLFDDERVLEVLRAAHAAVGIVDGSTHVELKLSPTGPRIVEINARAAGDLVPYLARLAGCCDAGIAAADVACGLPPRVERPGPARHAAVRFRYPDADDTRVGSVEFDDVPLPAAVDRRVVLAAPGSIVSPPPKSSTFGRLAGVTAVADTPQECRAAIEAALATVRLRVDDPVTSRA